MRTVERSIATERLLLAAGVIVVAGSAACSFGYNLVRDNLALIEQETRENGGVLTIHFGPIVTRTIQDYYLMTSLESPLFDGQRCLILYDLPPSVICFDTDPLTSP